MNTGTCRVCNTEQRIQVFLDGRRIVNHDDPKLKGELCGGSMQPEKNLGKGKMSGPEYFLRYIRLCVANIACDGNTLTGKSDICGACQKALAKRRVQQKKNAKITEVEP